MAYTTYARIQIYVHYRLEVKSGINELLIIAKVRKTEIKLKM